MKRLRDFFKYDLPEFVDGIKADPRKALIMSFVIIFLLGIALGANAGFTRGETLSHMLSVCLDKKDAVEIAEAYQKSGKEAAAAIFTAKEKCAPVPVQGYKVGKTVFTATSVRNGTKVTVSVVEILNDKTVEAYFITSDHVSEAVKGTDGEAIILKPERNA